MNRDHRERRTELLDALKDVRVQFWTCPNEDHKHVTWTGDIAACDTCGITSAMTGRLIRAAVAYERERLAELAEERRATYDLTEPCGCGRTHPGTGLPCAALIRSGLPFADLIREQP